MALFPLRRLPPLVRFVAAGDERVQRLQRPNRDRYSLVLPAGALSTAHSRASGNPVPTRSSLFAGTSGHEFSEVRPRAGLRAKLISSESPRCPPVLPTRQ